MHLNRIKTHCKRQARRYIYAGSQSVGEVRNQQLGHSLMTGLQMDEQIARIALNQGATPQTKTYLTDALGSVIAIAKADQSLEVGYAYSPYGQTSKAGVENEQAGSENNSQYTGRENDQNGLYYYRARYYDPVLKRFISEDPIGLAGGINSHAYVEGDPVSYTDPDGLRPRPSPRRGNSRDRRKAERAERNRQLEYYRRQAEREAWLRGFDRDLNTAIDRFFPENPQEDNKLWCQFSPASCYKPEPPKDNQCRRL